MATRKQPCFFSLFRWSWNACKEGLWNGWYWGANHFVLWAYLGLNKMQHYALLGRLGGGHKVTRIVSGFWCAGSTEPGARFVSGASVVNDWENKTKKKKDLPTKRGLLWPEARHVEFEKSPSIAHVWSSPTSRLTSKRFGSVTLSSRGPCKAQQAVEISGNLGGGGQIKQSSLKTVRLFL